MYTLWVDVSSNTWAKITLYQHQIKPVEGSVLGKEVICYVCVAVMYSDKLQSVCEGKLDEWRVENKPWHADVMREKVKTQQFLGMEPSRVSVLCH